MKKFKIEMVKDLTTSNKQVWRWHMKASNGKLVCTAGEAFFSKGNAKRAALVFMSLLVVPCEIIEPATAKKSK